MIMIFLTFSETDFDTLGEVGFRACPALLFLFIKRQMFLYEDFGRQVLGCCYLAFLHQSWNGVKQFLRFLVLSQRSITS